ncbi:MAG: methyltransferase domain-containing protein [Candidatus Eisenbacteria bacterium]|nr:methyltransferase domain-containing protein [Candidatus Eisenbacteria bacterium]
MKRSKSDEVQRFFEGYAADFEAIYGHSRCRNALERWIDRNLRKVMRLRFEETLRRTANPDLRTILDVGCGPGHYCAAFLQQGKDVVGIDLSPGMLELARRRVASMEHGGDVEFVQGDYLRHRFQRRFDAACLMGFFDYTDDPAAVLEKLKGDVSGEIYGSFPKRAGLLAASRRIRYRLRRCPLHLYSLPELRALLETCGFGGRYQIKDLGRDYFVRIRLRP